MASRPVSRLGKKKWVYLDTYVIECNQYYEQNNDSTDYYFYTLGF